MTLVEFLHPIRTGKQRDLVLAVLFYFKHFKDTGGMTASEIRSALVQAKIPNAKKMNVNSVINTSAPHVHSPGGKESGAFVFELTSSGEKHVRELLALQSPDSAMQHDVSTLMSLAMTIDDDTVRGFIDEAIVCLSAGALRAAVVFLWAGAIRTLHEEALRPGDAAIKAALAKQDPKSRQVKKLEDFAWIKDRTFLDASPDMGLLDKGERDTLVEALGLRNRSGHRTEYRPGANKVRSFIEDVVSIVFN